MQKWDISLQWSNEWNGRKGALSANNNLKITEYVVFKG